jgi:hypothetical protein
LFESLVLLGLLDLVFSFGSIVHRTMMTWPSSVEGPGTKRAGEHWRRPGPEIRANIRSVDVKNPSEWLFVRLWSISVD